MESEVDVREEGNQEGKKMITRKRKYVSLSLVNTR